MASDEKHYHWQPQSCDPNDSGAQIMRSLVLIYHEDLEVEIHAIIKRQMVVSRYTKIRDVIGARTDTMRETDFVQPTGANHMLIIVGDCEVIRHLAREFQELRARRGHGLRGYITPVEEVI